MFIQTEATPNPEVLKFIPGQPVSPGGAHEFRSVEETATSPLAASLFEVEGVTRAFFGSDFVTVTKDAHREWKHMKAPVLAAIMEHYTSGAPVLADANAPAPASEGHGEGDYDVDAASIVAEIKDLLDTRIRPSVAQDGGDILFDRYEPDTGVVWLHLRGACSGCPSSSATLKSGVENMLKHYVPEVTRVEQSI